MRSKQKRTLAQPLEKNRNALVAQLNAGAINEQS
jgi:hypothetical protein